jgi:glycosyltransferase 2 family protein
VPSRLRLALRAAISAGLIAFFALRLDFEPVRAAFARIDAGGLAAAVLVLAAPLAGLSALRWMVVCRALGLPMGARRSLELVYIGWFFNQLLPSAVGGDVVRALRTRALGVDWKRTVHCALLDRLLALAAMVVIVAAGWPLLAALVGDASHRQGIAIVTGAVALSFGLLVAADRFPLPRAATELAASARALLLGRFAAAAMLLSVLVHLTVALATWLIARALGVPVTLTAACVLMPLVLLVTMVPVSIGGWGVREGAMIAAFGYAGVEPPAAFVLSVLFGLGLVAASLPGALLWLRDPVRE